MTDHEMRIRLAEAMGWTDIRDIPAGGPVGVPPGGGGALTPIPNPLDNDADAARLRAWCVGRGWDMSIHLRPTTAQDDGWHSVTVTELPVCGGWREIGIGVAAPEDEPDPLRRERLALCRAVVRALDADQAGGVA
jgi:hypothetical protein